MILLAIDTASTLCAACVYDAAAGAVLGRTVRDLGKGHAEHLIPVVDETIREAGLSFDRLDRIVVSVGPGSFTGVRVGVATARGLALALRIPAVGVTTLEAIAAETRGNSSDCKVMSVLDAGRGEINLQLFDEAGETILGPDVATLEQAALKAREYGPVLAGSAAALVAGEADAGLRVGPNGATADIGVYATLGAVKAVGERPRPLYLRGADAKPQGGFVLPRTGS